AAAATTWRAGPGAPGGEPPPLLVSAAPPPPPPRRHRKRGESRERGGIEPLAPFRFLEVEPGGRQRLVGRTRAALRDRLLARLVIVLDLAQALADGVLDQRLQCHTRAPQIIEQRAELLREQRHPVLHSGGAAAL